MAVLGATTGRDGVLVESVAWETDALLIRAAVSAFEQVDQLVAAGFEAVDYAAGRAVGSAIATALPLAAITGLLGYAGYAALPEDLQHEVRTAAAAGGAALQDWAPPIRRCSSTS